MTDDNLEKEIAGLRIEIARLNSHRFIRLYNSRWRMLGFNFLRGLAFGLGSILGASVLVSVLVFTLAQIDFLPIVGEWAREISEMIQN